MDVITMLAFGYKFGYLSEDKDVYDYIKITEANMPIMLVMALFPALTKLVQSRPLRGLLPSERDPLGFGKFIAVAKRVVNERLASSDPFRRDMLGSFLRHGLTREEAQGEMLVQIIAGSDTTATAIRTTMLLLMGSPACYAKLAAELRTAVAEDRIGNPITDAQARDLPYLQAVIKEGLRMAPPVVGLQSTLVPKGGDVICGYKIPEGAEVGVATWAVQHSTAVYGEDATMFRPERWIEAKGDKLKEMSSTWDLIFKYGKWQCLGKTVALIELNKIFVEVSRLRQCAFQCWIIFADQASWCSCCVDTIWLL
jgi:cytochrome P450